MNCTIPNSTAKAGSEENFWSNKESAAAGGYWKRSASQGIRQAAAEAKEAQAAHDDLIDQVGSEIPEGAEKYVSDADKKAASSAGTNLKSLADMEEQATGAPGRVLQEVFDWVERLSPASTAGSSHWLDFSNAVAKRMVNTAADLQHWAARHMSFGDRSLQENPIVRAFNAVTPRREAALKRMMEPLVGIAKDLADPIARRLSISNNEALNMLGEAATLRFVMNRNKELYDQWTAKLDELNERTEPLTRDEERLFAELSRNVQSMDEWRDNPNAYADYKARREAGEKGLYLCSAGYTDAEAMRLLKEIKDFGLTDEEIEAASMRFGAFFANLTNERLAADRISAQTIREFPEQDPRRVPLSSRNDVETGFARDSSEALLTDPGAYSKAQGRTTPPDNAFQNAVRYAVRVSNELGSSELGTALFSAMRVAESQGRDIGLRSYRYSDIKGAGASSDLARQAFAAAVNRQGGLVVRLPERSSNGEVTGFQKMVIQFDPKFESNTDGVRITGADLNKSLQHVINGATDESNILHKLTGFQGQLFTRYEPFFAPGNMGMDFFERASHIASRDYYTEDGTRIAGSTMLPAYLKNMVRGGWMLMKVMRGTAEGKAAQYGEEFQSLGCFQDFNRRFMGNERYQGLAATLGHDMKGLGSTERLLRDPKYKFIRTAIDALGDKKDGVLRLLDMWNNYFNNLTGFAQYVTMRDLGISMRDAGANTLELMDLHQSGTWTHSLRMLYPFVRPTMQSSANMMRSLGFSYDPRGFIQASSKGAMVMAVTTAVGYMLQQLQRESMGQDENGVYLMDSFSVGQLSTALHFGVGNGIVAKIPSGFSINQIGMTAAICLDRVERGVMDPEEMMSEILFATMRNSMAGNWPEFSPATNPYAYAAQAFSPSIAQPIVENATNVSHFGSPISYALDQNQAKAIQGGVSTPSNYHTTAKWLLETFGVDSTPEALRNLWRGYMAGILRPMQTMVEADSLRRRTGEPSFAEENPMFVALGGSKFMTSTANAERNLFYKAYNAHRNKWLLKGLKMTSSDPADYKQNDPAAKAAYQEKLLRENGFSEKYIHDWLILEAAMHEIRKGSRAFSREFKPVWLSGTVDLAAMMPHLQNYSDSTNSIYSDALSKIYYYKK